MRYPALVLTILLFFQLSNPSESAESKCNEKAAPHWHHLTSPETRNIRLVILPLGSTEAHGPHLPLATDTLLAESLSIKAATNLHCVAILPSTSYGASFEHSSHPGTLAMSDSHLVATWDDIIDGVVTTGVKNIILVNGHGGQTPNAQLSIRSARFRHGVLAVLFDVQACLAQSYEAVTDPDSRELLYGIHGGLIETAVMMHLAPHLVRKHKLQHFQPRWNADNKLQPYGRVVSYGWRSEDICADGAVGNAAHATPILGQQIFDKCVLKLRNLVTEIRQTDNEHVLYTR